MHAQTAHQYDLGVGPDWQSIELFRQHGINAHWQPHFADERIFYPRPEIQPIYSCITTCGPRGNGLTEQIQKALGDEFNNDRYFYGEEHAKRLSLGRIVFQKSQFREITRRPIEAMALKRMVITDRLPKETRMEELFQDQVDLVYYDSADDAIDKIRYYASHDEERERIALNGYNKVLQNHTVKNRVDQLLELCCEVKPELREKL